MLVIRPWWMLELDCSSGVKDLGKVFLNLIRAAYDCIDEFDILKMKIDWRNYLEYWKWYYIVVEFYFRILFFSVCVHVNLCVLLYFPIIQTDNGSEFIIYLFYYVSWYSFGKWNLELKSLNAHASWKEPVAEIFHIVCIPNIIISLFFFYHNYITFTESFIISSIRYSFQQFRQKGRGLFV